MTDKVQQTTPLHSPAAQGSRPIYFVAVILLIALAVLSWWADNRLVEQARREIGRELNAVLNTTSRALDQWFQNFDEVLRIWGSDDKTRDLSQALLELGQEYESLRSTPLQGQISDHLRPVMALSLIHISEPTRRACRSRMPSSA